MPVISAAIAAVSIAVAATGLATVATAVVTVSAAIGTIGLAVSAVGMITGNETLTKVGSIMGYVGLAGGVAGGVLGGIGGLSSGAGFVSGFKQPFVDAAKHASDAWTKGIGSWFDDAAGAKVSGPLGNTAPGATPGTPPTGASTVQPGINPNAPSTSIGPSTGPGGSVQGGGYAFQPDATVQPAWASTTPPATPVPQGVVTPTPQGVVTPVPSMGAGSVVPPSSSLYPNVTPQINPLNAGGGGLLQGAATGVSSLPDWVKYAALTTGVQGVSGALGGWFQGASAEQKAELEQLMNSQRENQVQYLNRNNQYAPSINFPGVLNS